MKYGIDTLRTISRISPELAETLISAWGKIEFLLLIRDIREGKNQKVQAFVSTELLAQLKQLEQDHRQQFPALSSSRQFSIPLELANDRDYQLIGQRFSHVGEGLAETWGSPGFEPYMSSLMVDAQLAKRQGFPAEVQHALGRLREQHRQHFPALSVMSPEDRPALPPDEWIELPP